MDFRELAALRKSLLSMSQRHATSIQCFHDGGTNSFRHRFEEPRPGHISIASTATCLSSLVAAGQWEVGPWAAPARHLVEGLIKAEKKSAELEPWNVFSTAWLLEAYFALSTVVPDIENIPGYNEDVEKANATLKDGLSKGYAQVQDYPPSAYLTQLAFRMLRRRVGSLNGMAEKIHEWAWTEIHQQLALFESQSKTADVYQLAYSIMLAASLGKPGQATPDQALVLHTALGKVFEKQLADGSWERSQPLFHYPKVGSAYCYEYEMLTQLLLQPELEEQLLKYVSNLRTAANTLEKTAYKLPGRGLGWSSGHHPQFKGPESWSTASVYHFVHAFDRLLAEAIRRAMFDYLDSSYSPPATPRTDPKTFGPDFLDCDLTVPTGQVSLKETILARFVVPIANDASKVQLGQSLSSSTPTSAILFGPPGTSKTELSKIVADYLGWPLLTIDPGHFVRHGFEKVQTEADKIFSMLAVAEQVVVFLDELDEMVRDRSQETDIHSRFLTTSMLPRLATINRHRRIVIIVATNYIDSFDLAISRHGRFDIILQVMPPRADGKLARWDGAANHLNDLGLNVTDPELRKKVHALTFDEFKLLAPKLESSPTAADAEQRLNDAFERCTLNAKAGNKDHPEETWQQVCSKQADKTRLP
jgi:ATPase family associated with various cellular activities (AAA)